MAKRSGRKPRITRINRKPSKAAQPKRERYFGPTIRPQVKPKPFHIGLLTYRAVSRRPNRAEQKAVSTALITQAERDRLADRVAPGPAKQGRPLRSSLVLQNALPEKKRKSTTVGCVKKPDSSIAGKISAMYAKLPSGGRAQGREQRLRNFRIWCK